MLPFIRSDLANLVAYTPQPGGHSSQADLGSGDSTSRMCDRLDTNESPFDLPADLKQKLGEFYQREIEANRYPDGSHAVLKWAIADYVNESAALSDAPITPDHLSVGNGSDELIRSILIATCLGGQGSILVAEPTFSMYKILATTLGIRAIAIPRHAETFEMTLDAAQQAIDAACQPPVRVIFVVHPNSPTGNSLTTAELNWLRTLPQNILVVIDEAYFEYSQTSVVAELNQHPNWIILRTFSKAFRLAAHRVGYGIGHPDLIRALEKVRLPYNVPSFSQIAAQFALIHRETLLSVIPEMCRERQILYTELNTSPHLRPWPSNANFVYARLAAPNFSPDESSDSTLQQIVEQLRAWGTQIRHTGGGLRITVGSPPENQRTLERLSKVL